MKIDINTPVDELLDKYPEIGRFLNKNNIRYIICSECSWDGIGKVMMDSDKSEEEISDLLEKINEIIEQGRYDI